MFAYAGHETFVDTLLTKGASVSSVDANGHNAFYQASVADKPSILTRLITHVQTHGTHQELAVLINTPDARGITPLHIASVKGYESVTELLLQHGAQVNLSDDQGLTALNLSRYMGHEGIARQLLQEFNREC
jgi:ankyrin repeat protein